MEVILLEHVNKLGKMGDKVNVKNGYARNYLLPQKKALRKTKDNLAYFEGKRRGTIHYLSRRRTNEGNYHYERLYAYA